MNPVAPLLIEINVRESLLCKYFLKVMFTRLDEGYNDSFSSESRSEHPRWIKQSGQSECSPIMSKGLSA